MDVMIEQGHKSMYLIFTHLQVTVIVLLLTLKPKHKHGCFSDAEISHSTKQIEISH